MELTTLVAMSNIYGSNPEYILAGGGNTSVKNENRLFVKGSGTQLATIKADDFVEMERASLHEIMGKEYPGDDAEREAAYLSDVMSTVVAKDSFKRPSVESLLHNLFSQTYVLHLHPAIVNGLTCSVDGEKYCKEILGEEVLWMPICRPGYTLARECYNMMNEYEAKHGHKVQIVLLQNHGIFVGGDSVGEISRLYASVISKLQTHVKRSANLDDTISEEKLAVARVLAEKTGHTVAPVPVAEVDAYTVSKEAAAPLLAPFTPDHIVYCGAYRLYLENLDNVKADLEAFVAEKDAMPRVILVEGKGAYIMEDNKGKAEKAQLLIKDALKVAVYAENFGGPLCMTEELTYFITHWEAESYRSKK